MNGGACTGCISEKGGASYKGFGPVIFASGGFGEARLTPMPKSSSSQRETLRGVGGLVFVTHGNRFANDLGSRKLK